MPRKSIGVKPIGKRVVVKPEEVEQTTPGGLVIPPTAQEGDKSEMGEIVILGTGEKDFEFTVSKGDKVFFKKYAPDELVIDGESYYVMNEEDILAIVE